jgi:hypothetical protein
MGRAVQAAVVEVEADYGHQPAGQGLLALEREGAVHRDRRPLSRLLGQDLLQEPGQERRQGIEDPVDLCCGEARIVLVQERVVGRAAEGLGLGSCGLPLQLEQGFQGRQYGGKVSGGAGLAPNHLAVLPGLGQGLHQIGVERRGVAPLPGHLAQVGALPGTEALAFGLGSGQELGHGGIGQELVAGDAEHG